MSKEEMLKKIEELETQINEITLKMSEEEIEKATEEEKLKYLELISEIKMKIEILKSL